MTKSKKLTGDDLIEFLPKLKALGKNLLNVEIGYGVSKDIKKSYFSIYHLDNFFKNNRVKKAMRNNPFFDKNELFLKGIEVKVFFNWKGERGEFPFRHHWDLEKEDAEKLKHYSSEELVSLYQEYQQNFTFKHARKEYTFDSFYHKLYQEFKKQLTNDQLEKLFINFFAQANWKNPFIDNSNALAYSRTYSDEVQPLFLNNVVNSFVNYIRNKIAADEEQVKIRKIEEEAGFHSYFEAFSLARSMKREIIFYAGPTNSGKTYEAMKDLIQAENGLYLAPLRLLALEGYDLLTEHEVKTSLITGEERVIEPRATHVASTIEMADFSKVYDCVVIDEAQMIADPHRGWAWTAAIAGIAAKKIILAGAIDGLPSIKKIAEALGEKVEVKEFKRKNELHFLNKPVYLKQVKAGDALIAFSRKEVLAWAEELVRRGISCSVIYGSLSPDVRKNEANKFRTGETSVLVATDAIGMGLNLPISRVLFTTAKKFDGVEKRVLTQQEVKQIAGRAGRYGLQEKGWAGLVVLDGEEVWDVQENVELLHNLWSASPFNETYGLKVKPNLNHLLTVSSLIDTKEVSVILEMMQSDFLKDHEMFEMCNMEDSIQIAKEIEKFNLPFDVKFTYSHCPIDVKNEKVMGLFLSWVRKHSQRKIVSFQDFAHTLHYEKQFSPYNLSMAEQTVKLLIAYKWLHFKYMDIYPDSHEVNDKINSLNSYIMESLRRNNMAKKNKTKKGL